MHESLQFARRRSRLWVGWVLGGALVLPLVLALLPVLAHRAVTAWGDFCLPHYTARLEFLQQQNAQLRTKLACLADAEAENAALRTLTGAARPAAAQRPARVLARLPGALVLAGHAETGCAVTDSAGRFAGRIIQSSADRCVMAQAGSARCPTAGLAAGCGGLLQVQGGWHLTGLPLHCRDGAGTVAATPDGFWLGVFADAPQPEAAGLTQQVTLRDTADFWDEIYFVCA